MNRKELIEEFKPLWDKLNTIDCEEYEDDCNKCPLSYDNGTKCTWHKTKEMIYGLIKEYNKNK